MRFIATPFLAFAFLCSGATAQEPVRVACIGDSITEGNANAEYTRNSYPQILGRMLEQAQPGRWSVGNFGKSGATLLSRGSKPYRDQEEFVEARAFEPAIVILNLGTNDAAEINWSAHGAEFKSDLAKLLDEIASWPGKPQIYSSNLTPYFDHGGSLSNRAAHREEVQAILAAAGRERGLEQIDFEGVLNGMPRLFPDALHPNTAGNVLLATAVFRALVGVEPPADASLESRPVLGPSSQLVVDGNAQSVRGAGWVEQGGALRGTGNGNWLRAACGIGAGDFTMRARLRMDGQQNSAAGFGLGKNFFGFEGARGTLFRNGPNMGGLRLLHPSPMLWERGDWIDFEVTRNGDQVWFRVDGFVADMALIPGPIETFGFNPMRSTMHISDWSVRGSTFELVEPHMEERTKACPWIDLSSDLSLRVEWEGGFAGGGHLETGAEGRLPVSRSGRDRLGLALPDGRWLETFVDTHAASPTTSDLVAWVGTREDLKGGREGAFTARFIRAAELGGTIDNESLFQDANGAFWVIASGRKGDAEERISLRLTLGDLDSRVPRRGYRIPTIDLDREAERQVVVDREAGQYLGHPTTCLLEDGRTVLCVYPKGHGKGGVVYKRSSDGGRTWSERIQLPRTWETSREVPTIHRVIDPKTGKKRLIVWSGLYPARLGVSEDDGRTWSELEPAGEWGGIVVMGFVERLSDGRYLAMFHDDGRFFRADGKRANPPVFTLYQTFSADGGLSWSDPEAVWSGTDVHLCEPGCVRSPDGKQLAVLLRENSRKRNAYVIFSDDEGTSWSSPRELPASLTGDRHTGKYAPDGRLFLSFRDRTHRSPTHGDWVGWVGSYEDIRQGREGQYRVRLKDNTKGADCAYPGVEILPDGTFLTTTYGHWSKGEEPYVLSVRFRLDELDVRAAGLPKRQTLFRPGDLGAHTFRIPAIVRTNTETLIAACDVRNPSGRDLPNDIDTAIRRSVDGGRTWTPARRILDHPAPEGAADPALLVDRETGRVWLAVTWAEGVHWKSSKPGFGEDSFHPLLLYSDDDGETWSDPIDVVEALKDPKWRSVWFSPGHGIQASSGRLIFPFSAADEEGRQRTYAALSDDHGKTWMRSGRIGERTNEAMIAELPDGRLICNLRSTHGKNLRATAYSADGGNSWSGFEHHSELIEPVCQASLLHLSPADTELERHVQIFSNPASKKRENLTLRASFDGGRTWPYSKLLHLGAAAYSDLVLIDRHTLGVLYEGGQEGSYEGIQFARVPLSWLFE